MSGDRIVYFDGQGENVRPISPAEEKAIHDLLRLAKRWPRSLMLASMGGSLYVFDTQDHMREGLDSEKAIAYVGGIPNTGGDW